MTSSFIQYFQSTVTIWRINVEIWKYKIRKRHYLSDCQTLLKQRNPIQLNSALIQILQLDAISASKSTFHYIGLCSIIGKTRSRITRSLSWTSTTATRLRKERAECLLSLLFQLFSLFTWLSFLYFSSYHSSLCYLFFYLSSFFFYSFNIPSFLTFMPTAYYLTIAVAAKWSIHFTLSHSWFILHFPFCCVLTVDLERVDQTALALWLTCVTGIYC